MSEIFFIEEVFFNMDITTNRVNSANATINATIPNEIVEKNINKIAKELSKTANIAGFRKGKVPVSAIKKQYGDRLNQDAETQALQDLLDSGLEKLEINRDSLIGEPQISKYDKSESAIEIEVNVAVRPEIDLGDYSSMIPDIAKPEVKDEEVQKRIEDLASAQAPYTKISEERALADGDMALIDFVGTIDGVAFKGGTAEGFSLKIGSGQFIPGFEDQMIGMNSGEKRDVNVTFPENYQAADLAGKEAVFAVTLHEIQEQGESAFDDELAKKLLPNEENATLEMLKERTKEQIEAEELHKLYNDELKPNLMKEFVKNYSFDLPDFVVDQEIDIAVNKDAQNMSEDEINEIKENADKLKELREAKREEAVESVKATFIVDALAKAENVQVDEQEVMQTIYYEALQTGQDPKAVYEQYHKAGYLPAIQMSMVEDKVLNKLLDSKVKGA